MQSIFGWGPLEFGFLMMATGATGILVQVAFFGFLSRTLGVVGTGALGALLLSVGQILYASPAALSPPPKAGRASVRKQQNGVSWTAFCPRASARAANLRWGWGARRRGSGQRKQ